VPDPHTLAAPKPSTHPWRHWLQPPDGDMQAWLTDLDVQLHAQEQVLDDEETQTAAVWSHVAKALHRFRPDEVGDVVNAQLEVARSRAAVDALRALVRLERDHLASAVEDREDTFADSTTVRRLLEGLAGDRVVSGRALTAEVLETLCSIALDLELTERRVGHDPVTMSEALTDLRTHITAAANMVRALPDQVQVRPETDEQTADAVRRCLDRYAASLDVEFSWTGADVANAESAAALLWVLQEILHRLHHTVAGRAAVSVRVGAAGTALLVEAPTTALLAPRADEDWLLRCRLRLELAGGAISTGGAADVSFADVQLP